MKPRVFFVALFLILCTSTLVEDMDEDIGEAIFHNGQYYLIYVYDQIQKEYFVPFRSYCQLPDTRCTTMNPKVEQYNQFVQFIGADRPSYFLILDASTRKKYIMENKEITVESIKQFVEKYHAGALEAYISSQQLPTQDSTFVTKLVGKTIVDFVSSKPQSYKVILFTTDNSQICENCPQILQDFKELAEKMHSDQREFGYIDLIKNQHPDINQEVVPVVAVYKQMQELHVFKKFYVSDLEKKIYQLERGETLEEEEDSGEEYANYDPDTEYEEEEPENVEYGGDEVQEEL